MEFQVISAKRLPKIRAGRNLIVFYFRKDMEAVKAGIEDRKTDTIVGLTHARYSCGTRL